MSKQPAIHLSFNVRNLQESVDFYRQFLGVEPTKQKPDFAKFETDAPGLHLALNDRGESTDSAAAFRGNLLHLGIRLDSTDEVQTWQERLAETSLDIREETNTTCCYARQDKLWAEDPDGNAWEVYTVFEDVEKRDARDEDCCTKECSCA